MNRLDRRVFREMLREEWRLHTTLFGGSRFAAFPVLISLIAAGLTWLLTVSGTSVAAVIGGLHALVFAFGLHTGSIGFISRDAVRNLIGDETLLLFTGRTLPLSARRLVGIFLAKDVIYYSALFIAPLAIGVLAIGGLAVLDHLPLLWLTLAATFVLGALVTVAGIGLSTRLPRPLVGVIFLSLVGVPWIAGIDPLSFTPYAFYRSPAVATALASLVPIGAFAVLGHAAYDPTHRRSIRTRENRFEPVRARLGDPAGLLTKSLLDVYRSSGGLWKVLFSTGVLLAVTAGLIQLIEPLTGMEPSPPISFGALLGLSAFTTYNWLTQFDSFEEYSHHPIDVRTVFRAKFTAFGLLGIPAAVGGYAVAVAVFGGPPGAVAAGALLLIGGLVYLFGLTVYLTGFDPNEFLFDTLLYLTFTVAVSGGVVPPLIVGFVLVPPTAALLWMVGAWGLLMGVSGIGLFHRSIPRWTARYRE